MIAAPRDGEWLAPCWIVVLFSNFPLYLGMFVTPLIQPLHWIVLLAGATLLLLARPAVVIREVPMLYPVALAAYLALCLAAYILQGGGDSIVLRQRLLGVLVAILTYLCFALSPRALEAARRAMVWVVLASVAINVYDITHPLTLIPANSELATLGRAAGLFMNPNQSGAALVLGLTITLGVVTQRWRVAYAIVVSLGVVLTLSRGALLGLLLVFGALLVEGRTLRREQVARIAALATVAGYAFWLTFAAELQSRFNIDPALVRDRILWILDPSGRADFSQAERAMLAERGWLQFVSSPFFGNGVGSTELWELRSSTHNLYIMLASDFGLVGWLVLPALLLAAVRRNLATLPGGIAAAFLLLWGLVSHNVLGEYYILIAMSLMASISSTKDGFTRA
jgi:O-antigen ligase